MLALLWSIFLYLLGHAVPAQPGPPPCLESVQVVAPGDMAECPWGAIGEVTVAGDNVAFHCVCPR